MPTLTRISLPQFGVPTEWPLVDPAEYIARIDSVRERMQAAKLDFLVVYGDREHAANLEYLTSFDPRFEEALLLLAQDGRRKLLVGNECMGYLPEIDPHLEIELFQDFSLLGQPRGDCRSLHAILSDFGIATDTRVGCAGWKYYEGAGIEGGMDGYSECAIEIPAYIVDRLRTLTEDPNDVVNATQLFMNARDGLRITNSVAEIARLEFAAAHCSQSVLTMLRRIEVGSRERDLEHYLDSAGLPLSCHRMVSFGEKARRGLSSPSDNRARLGDPFTMALGVQGSLICRAGAVAHSENDLPSATRDFYPRFVANYFEVVATWYSNIRVGANCGDVVRAVEACHDPSLFKIALNPGHYIHLDEWVNSPFYAGSKLSLRSGMALQMDIIPISQGPFCYANMEDGIVIADAELQAALQQHSPAMWARIQQRRAFMRDAIGIPLDDSVLPLSNIAGWLAPYILDTDVALING
jgi:hypothetical protein